MRSVDLLDQHTLSGFPAIGFYLFFDVSKYHVRRDDVLPGGVLCDCHLYSAIRVPNKLQSVFGSPDCHRWESPVLCYHVITANYPYPFLGKFFMVILNGFIRKVTIKTVKPLPFPPLYVKLPYMFKITIFYVFIKMYKIISFPKHYPDNLPKTGNIVQF